MSQLIDKLNRVAKTAPQSMGFRTAQVAQAKPQMLLIASLAQPESLTSLTNYISGADAVLMRLTKANLEAKAMQKMTRSLDIPWGVWLKDIDGAAAGTIVEAGGDFVVFPAGSAISLVPQGDKAGKVLEIEPSFNDGLLRAISDLPVDAVLIADEAKSADSLTWHDLMLFQRAASLLSKPLLVSVPPKISADELKTLWDIGVDGVVIEVNKELPADRLKELRRAADALSSSSRRKRGKTEALLPSIRMEAPAEEREDEEEE